MCLEIGSKLKGYHPYNKPYNDSTIRYKVLCRERDGKLSSLRDFTWSRNTWHTSSRRTSNPLTRIGSGVVNKGFHFFVNAFDAHDELDFDQAVIVAFKVKGFVAAGTNNGDTLGEVWHHAKPIGFVTVTQNGKSYITPFKK